MRERARIAVLISGTGSNMAALLYASRADDCPYEVTLVASNTPQAPGLALAQAEDVATFALSHKGMNRDAHDARIEAEVRAAGAEYIALAGYMRVLSAGFVARWSGRMVNIHPSLLPKYPGLHTHERALAAGDAEAGCSVHLVTEALDAGPLLGQTRVAVLPGDTPASLAARVLIAEHQLYPRCLAALVRQPYDAAWLTSQVRQRALALPQAEETLSHGTACFGIVKGKKFAWVTANHHSDGKVGVLVKISGLDEQTQLIDADPERHFRPAYFGNDWLGIRLDLGDTDWESIEGWLRRSWLTVAPKKLAGLMAAAAEF